MKSLRRCAPEGGRNRVDWVAALPWTRWPESRGTTGRNQWNTQSEWEDCASGGQTRRYWYGLKVMPGLIASAGAWSPAAPRPRSQAIANQFGVFDPLGNVWEWCADCVADDGSPTEADVDAGQGVIRGGGGFTDPEDCTCQLRKVWRTDRGIPTLGFRIVLESTERHSPPEPEAERAK